MVDFGADLVLSILLILCVVVIGLILDLGYNCFRRTPSEKCNKIIPKEILIRLSRPEQVRMISVVQDGKEIPATISQDVYADGAGPKHLAIWKPTLNIYTKSLTMVVNNAGEEFNTTTARLKNNKHLIQEFRLPIGAIGVHQYDLLPIICGKPLIDTIPAN